VKELRLTSDEDDKISNEELAALARRCLIDVRRLSPERRDRLRVHVAGIMRCASVLLDARNADVENGGNDLTDEDVYDAPRALGKIPVRTDDDIRDDGSEKDDEWQSNDASESRAVMQSENVRSKMVQSGGESFFSVVTKRGPA